MLKSIYKNPTRLLIVILAVLCGVNADYAQPKQAVHPNAAKAKTLKRKLVKKQGANGALKNGIGSQPRQMTNPNAPKANTPNRNLVKNQGANRAVGNSVGSQPSSNVNKQTGVQTNKQSTGVVTEYSQIIPYLQKQPDCSGQNVEFKIHQVKIGPEKTAYVGVCWKGYGKGFNSDVITRVVVLYEVTPNGLRKLIQRTFFEENRVLGLGLTKVGTTEHVSKGYYDFITWTGDAFTTHLYRWNGSQYQQIHSWGRAPGVNYNFWSFLSL